MIATLLTFVSLLNNLPSCLATRQLRNLEADGGELTDADKMELLDKHNEYRSITALGNTGSQPAATNMIQLVWDDDLAAGAKEHAAGCVFSHGDSGFGETLFAAASSKDTVDNIAKLVSGVESWYDEHSFYTYSDNSCDGICGHYTQVVWADTSKVGCGYAECSTIFPNTYPYQVYLVCRYDGPGNYLGVKPYETDSSCPTDYTLNITTGLCVYEEVEEEEEDEEGDAETEEEETDGGIWGNELSSLLSSFFWPF